MRMDDRLQEHARQLDLLVDGEMNEQERRELLLSFDREPDAWRRCALAFLEAQSWRTEMGRLVDDPVNVASDIRPATAPGPAGVVGQRFAWPKMGAMFALAASLALAFSLGLATRRGLPGPGNGVLAPESRSVADVKLPVNKPSEKNAAPSTSTWANSRLVVDDQGRLAEEFEVPLVDGNSVDDSWLNGPGSPVSEDELRELERLGFKVQQRRRLTPYATNDGRQIVVPEHEVEITPVNNVPN